jgi:hypothetical protein
MMNKNNTGPEFEPCLNFIAARHVCIFRLVVDLELHHRARVQSHHYSDEMARKSELEEYLPKCRSWHRIERFDEIDESHVGFQVVFLSLP